MSPKRPSGLQGCGKSGLQLSQEKFNLQEGRASARLRPQMPTTTSLEVQRRRDPQGQILWRGGLQPSQEELNLQEGRASARLRPQMPITTSNPKYCVGEVHEDSNPMAERSATVTRRVHPARGKGFCEAETSNANNDVKPEVRHRRGPQGLKSDGREVCNRHRKSSTCKREGLLRRCFTAAWRCYAAAWRCYAAAASLCGCAALLYDCVALLCGCAALLCGCVALLCGCGVAVRLRGVALRLRSVAVRLLAVCVPRERPHVHEVRRRLCA
jgi:hypothetical protein